MLSASGEGSQFRFSRLENNWREQATVPCAACCHSLTDKLTFEVFLPIPVTVYWRWFWSSLWGRSSGHAICHLDCIRDSLERARWLLIVYRLCCLRLHKDHMHRARWWTYTLIMSLYLCAGRIGTIRSPLGTPLFSSIMLFLSKYSLIQLSSPYLQIICKRERKKKKTSILSATLKADSGSLTAPPPWKLLAPSDLQFHCSLCIINQTLGILPASLTLQRITATHLSPAAKSEICSAV